RTTIGPDRRQFCWRSQEWRVRQISAWTRACAARSGGIVRPNRDTLYSFAVVDLDAGPVTITLPEAGKRFMGMQVINQDQYTLASYYGAGAHTLTRKMVSTRYAIAVVRYLVDFSNPEGVRQVHALQD